MIPQNSWITMAVIPANLIQNNFSNLQTLSIELNIYIYVCMYMYQSRLPILYMPPKEIGHFS